MKVHEKIAEILRNVSEVDRRDVAQQVGMEDRDPAYRMAWQAARDAVLEEGIAFRSNGGAKYQRASIRELLHQAGRDQRAAQNKIRRQQSKLTIIIVEGDDPHLVQAAQRRAEHAQRWAAAMRKR